MLVLKTQKQSLTRFQIQDHVQGLSVMGNLLIESRKIELVLNVVLIYLYGATRDVPYTNINADNSTLIYCSLQLLQYHRWIMTPASILAKPQGIQRQLSI